MNLAQKIASAIVRQAKTEAREATVVITPDQLKRSRLFKRTSLLPAVRVEVNKRLARKELDVQSLTLPGPDNDKLVIVCEIRSTAS